MVRSRVPAVFHQPVGITFKALFSQVLSVTSHQAKALPDIIHVWYFHADKKSFISGGSSDTKAQPPPHIGQYIQYKIHGTQSADSLQGINLLSPGLFTVMPHGRIEMYWAKSKQSKSHTSLTTFVYVSFCPTLIGSWLNIPTSGHSHVLCMGEIAAKQISLIQSFFRNVWMQHVLYIS